MSGTYQSRVFTFISKRTNRLKDTCSKGLRHLKVAVVWSGQILLYPLHLLAQTTKIFQPQLPPPPPQKSLPQPTSDINIEQALDLVAGTGHQIEIATSTSLVTDDWSFVDDSLWNTGHGNIAIADREITYSPRSSRQATATKPIIRGLSSLLSDRSLVLVTTENEILDILNLAQQQELRRRIGIDLAIDWHQWQTNRIDTNNHSDRQLSANRELLITGSSVNNQQAIGSSKDQVLSPNLFDRWQNWLQSFKSKPTSNHQIDPISTTPTSPKSLTQFSPAQYSFTPQPPKIDRCLDLPQLPPIVEDRSTHTLDNPVRATISNLQPDWMKQLWNYYRDYIYIPAETEDRRFDRTSEFQLIPIEPKSGKIRQNKDSNNYEVNLSTSVNTRKIERLHLSDTIAELVSIEEDRDFAGSHDWIETDSEILGYSRSPLTKLLAWLDRIFLSIENWLIKIWQTIIDRVARN
jgi:hypothetical protein